MIATRYDPREHGCACDVCPRRTCTPVLPEGPGKGARYVWLGQDPGEKEVKKGRPFVGPTGVRTEHIWQRACEAMGIALIPRSEIKVTNAALCLPPKGGGDGEARAAMTCCRVRLAKELLLVHPEAAILAMGKWAWYALTGKTQGVGKYIGFHVKLDRKEIYAQAVANLEVYRAKRGKAKKLPKYDPAYEAEDIPF